MSERADRNVARMRSDTESDWPYRLISDLASLPCVDEDDVSRYGHLVAGGDDLTEREIMVLKAASHGMGYKETAAVLGVSWETVRTQLSSARRRLRAKNTTHAVCEAIRKGLIP